MGRKMKKLTRAGAGALAGVMVFGLAAPLAPLSVEAADEVKNLAIGSTATVNDKETDYWGADKAVDGIVNRTAAKRDQSRWATVTPEDATYKAVEWSSNNDNIATVDASGNVTAVAPGQAVITATCKDDRTKTATCTVCYR